MSTSKASNRIALALGFALAVPAVASAEVVTRQKPPPTGSRTAASDAWHRVGLEPRPGEPLLPPMGIAPRTLVQPGSPAEAPAGVATASLGRSPASAPQARGVGSGSASVASGPVGVALTPRAAPVQLRRGGGPASVPGPQVLRIEDQPAQGRVALPLGCSRLHAEGSPAVTDVALRVTRGDGSVTVLDAARGRSETAVVCANEAGSHQVAVQLRGPARRVLAAQLFVGREPGVAEGIR